MSAPVAPDQSLTSETVTAAALAQGFRAMQLNLRGQMLRDATAAWSALDLNRLSATWPGWLRLMTALMIRYHEASSQQAVRYYAASRQLAVGSGITVASAVAPNGDWLARAFGYSVPSVCDSA